MGFGGRRVGSALPHLLLCVTVAELALYRLAVPALEPRGAGGPPLWHQGLSYVGLYLFYFASALAAGAVFAHLAQVVRRREERPALLRYGLVVGGAAFLAFTLMSLAVVPTDRLQFLLEVAFTSLVILTVLSQLTGEGDLRARVGIGLLAVPLVIHFYGPLSLRVLHGEEVLWGELPDRLQSLGQWSLVFVALASPYCFAPRPMFRSLSRVAPLAVATFVGLVGIAILRRNYEVGVELAMLGLGIDLGPMPPTTVIALYLLALVAGTWALIAALTGESAERRRIGVGLGLVFVGGYSFQWPLQYLVSAAGLLTIADGARRVVADEEETDERRRRFRSPPLSPEVWEAYVGAVVAALKAEGDGEEAGAASAVTVRGEDGNQRTHIVSDRGGIRCRLTVEREEGAILFLDILCGEEPEQGAAPAWTLEARGERRLSVGEHPAPPSCGAAPRKVGDEPFDRRFRIRDAGGLTGALLDEGLRARATALIDGWMALWPERALRYRVYPGRGAPLDHPIPISELAFRGPEVPASVERLLTLLRFLVDVWRGYLSRGSDERGEA